MTNQELQELVEAISLRDFQRPFVHRATFNARLKTTGGRYHMQDHHLDFNPKMATELPLTSFTAIIKHELCHYHLHLAELPYDHRSPEFRQLLRQVGGSRFAPQVPSNQHKYHYYCPHCQIDYYRQRQIDLHRYVCGRCQGKLVLVELNHAS
ncbi:SprT family protein [Lapidilactobacillus bayanensis]|uniref:SprT family protein n=1 Tax=Lapidilactobacillus bayanensis TaxID=2485998 RepID=UPI000F7856DE|nr:SprT family protein [Lapidilactobacillus bayanensis]